MAIDTTVRDALITALIAGTATRAQFLAWANSLLALNQINAQVIAEIREVAVHGD